MAEESEVISTSWLRESWDVLDERAQHMLLLRGAGLTLDAVGGEYGLTRERARQIIGQAERDLLLSGDTFVPNWRATLSDMLTMPATAEPDIARALGIETHAAVASFVRGADFKPPRTWAGNLPGLWTSEPDALDALLREVVKQAPFRAEELAQKAAELGVPSVISLEAVMSHPNSPLIRATGSHWLRRRARGRDAAYLWLLDRGDPHRAEELLEVMEVSNVHAVREALRRDDRFVRIRPEGTWALTEWALPDVNPYSSAVEAVVAVVSERGPLSRNALFAVVAERYPVTAWRLSQCLLSDRIGTTAEGLIDLVSRGAAPMEEREPQQPNTMAIDPTSRVLGVRLTVDKQVLRGSGVIVNSWLTWKLGLRLAPMSKTFTVEDGPTPLVVRRGTSGAQLSSLRQHVVAQGMGLGCDVAVIIRTDTSSAQIRHACEPGHCAAANVQQDSGSPSK